MFGNGDMRFQNGLLLVVIRIDSPDPARKALVVNSVNRIVLKNQRVVEGNGHNAPVFLLTLPVFQIHRQATANAHTSFHQVKRTSQDKLSLRNCRLRFQIAQTAAVQIQPCYWLVAFQGKNTLNDAVRRK